MKITSAKFVKGITEADELLEGDKPQIAIIGRSNVGKSTVINTLTNVKNLAKTSSFPGRTQEINLFLINKSFYLVDLPGYGFAKASLEGRERLQKLIFWYLFDSDYDQKKIILIIDAKVGPTANDLEILHNLEKRQKNVVVVANKVDKLKSAEYKRQFQKIEKAIGFHKIIPYSSVKKIGISELTNEIIK